jgi:hypothetical protein
MNPLWVNNYGASLWLGPDQSSKKQHWLSHPEHIRLSCLGRSSSIPCCCEYRAVGRHPSSLQQVELQICCDVFSLPFVTILALLVASSSTKVSKLRMTHTYFPPCKPSQGVDSFFPVNATSARRAVIQTRWSGTVDVGILTIGTYLKPDGLHVAVNFLS